jgi:hypothetical protein
MGIGDWGLGIGDWPKPQIPNPQSPIPITIFNILYYPILKKKIKIFFYLKPKNNK